MSYSAGEEFESKVASRYSLVIAVAKRAKQLREGQARMVDCKSKNYITIALEEISAGKLAVLLPTEEQIRAEERHAPSRPIPSHVDTSELLKVPETLEGLDDVEADLASLGIADTEVADVEVEVDVDVEAESADDLTAELDEVVISEEDSSDKVSEE